MANQGPYQPPDYSANSDDFLQYLSQMGGSQGLGAPSFNPPSDMSPSMSWMGAPQGYPGGQMGEQMGMMPGMGQMDPMGGQPQYDEQGFQFDPQWQDPGYTSFGPEGGQMQQVGGQQQQGPTGHPILDKLMSPDMQDRAMAAAIFARGFVAPQEAINWAMQIRQQRQAQQARYDQSAMEQQEKRATVEYKRREDKLMKSWNRARDAGVLDKVEARIGKPWTEWDDEDSRLADNFTSEEVRALKDQKKAADDIKIKDTARTKTLSEAYKYGKWPKRKEAALDDPDFQAALESARTIGEKNRKYTDEIRELNKKLRAAQAKAAAADADDPTRKDRLKVMLAEVGDLDGDIKQWRNEINDIYKSESMGGEPDMDRVEELQDKIDTAMESYRDKVDEAGTTASGKAYTPKPKEPPPAPTISDRAKERRAKLGLQ